MFFRGQQSGYALYLTSWNFIFHEAKPQRMSYWGRNLLKIEQAKHHASLGEGTQEVVRLKDQLRDKLRAGKPRRTAIASCTTSQRDFGYLHLTP